MREKRKETKESITICKLSNFSKKVFKKKNHRTRKVRDTFSEAKYRH
jgi:hypothetical protein